MVILCNFLLLLVCFSWLIEQQRGGLAEGTTPEDFVPLFLAKSFGFLDGEEQLLLQLFVAFIGRQVQAVKTGTQTLGGGSQ